VSTVSRALSDPHKVNATTRDRVRKIADELGYSQVQTVRSRTGVIGLIVPDITNPFFPPVVKAVQARADVRGKLVVVADTDEHPADEILRARALQSRVDGLIMVSPRSDEDRLDEIAKLRPVVFVHRQVEGAANVLANDPAGVDAAVEHLVALGHRRIGYLNGPRRSWSNGRRQEAVRISCSERGVELVEFGPFEPQIEAGMSAAPLVAAANLTAVIAYDDMIAVGLMASLLEHGKRPGAEISVVGIDDSPMAAGSYPQLTSVRVPGAAAGATAVDLLLDLIDEVSEPEEPPALVELDTSLIVRGSTGPASTRLDDET
jgi:DNA-binding LacI/PurR family transcriptional regulator